MRSGNSYNYNYGVITDGVYVYNKMCHALDERIGLERERFRRTPVQANRWELVRNLTKYANTLMIAQRITEACGAHQESVAIIREILQEDEVSMRRTPQSLDVTLRTRQYYTEALASYGNALRIAGRISESCHVHRDYVAVERMRLRRKENDREDLAHALKKYGDALKDAGRLVQSSNAYREAIPIQQYLVQYWAGEHPTYMRAKYQWAIHQGELNKLLLRVEHLGGLPAHDVSSPTDEESDSE